jgi:lipoate-protein ligase B
MTNNFNILDLGQKGYKEVWDLQKRIHKKRIENEIDDSLLLVEHRPVITLGKSGNEKNLLIQLNSLKEKEIEFYQIERGGDITFHGFGQIVGYPIFNIKKGLIGIKPFITKIEDVIISTLAEFGIKGLKKKKMTGVWTNAGKICSIGIAVKKWVSFHGFALNVNTDLKYFDIIIPCGLKNIKMTSMQKILNKEVSINAVKKIIKHNFAKFFNKNPKDVCLTDLI